MNKIFAGLLILFVIGCSQQSDKVISRSGPYLGEKLPGDDPVVFAPGWVSTGITDRDISMTPDGNEIYFAVALRSVATIQFSKLVNGIWTEPEVASFATNPDYFFFEPHVTPDGKHMMFLSTMPPPGEEPLPGWQHQHIWVVDRKNDGSWGEPYIIGEPITTEDNDYYPSVTKEGTVYFTRSKKDNFRETAIYRSRKVDGKYQQPERLPEVVNQYKGYNGFISPDESYLIVCSNQSDKLVTPGVPDYLIFFRNENDEWSDAISLGQKVNVERDNAASSYVSPDGKYFFFSSSRMAERFSDSTMVMSGKLLKDIINSCGNGSSDTYWMKADFIEALRPTGY